jgi:imidazoleglycerol-phosphate dehydratase/histidinol-phosphatase
MYELTIDKKFFDLETPLSTGLISGLKKLSQKNFNIIVEHIDPIKYDSVLKILQLEGIDINKAINENPEKKFSILTTPVGAGPIGAGKTKNKNLTVVFNGSKTDTFEKAVNLILTKLRTASMHRKTKETDINIELSLDGLGITNINTGIGFFDHMLEQIAKHANINLSINVKGDLSITL